MARLKGLSLKEYKTQGFLFCGELIDKYADVELKPLTRDHLTSIFNNTLEKMRIEIGLPFKRLHLSSQRNYHPHCLFNDHRIMLERVELVKKIQPIVRKLENLVSPPNVIWSKCLKDIRSKNLNVWFFICNQ